jgi:hypothetical protein
VWIDPSYCGHLLDMFRGLDAALDEHEANGTRTGDPVYAKIHAQLAEDVAMVGYGKDAIPHVAAYIGQLSTYNRLERLMPKQLGPDEQEAITHLEKQISALAVIRANPEQAHANSAQFIGWKSHTVDLLTHFIPSSSGHFRSFRMLSFRSNIMIPDYPSARIYRGPNQADLEKFAADAEVAIACLSGAIEHLRVFGISRDEPASASAAVRPREPRGLTQVFHGPVNQAVAMDRATQNVRHIGPSGNTLAELSDLLQQSDHLTRRELADALHAAKQLDVEVQKPEASRDWKSFAEWGNTLLGIAGKATDLTAKLAPHLPWITRLIEQAKHHG